MAMTMSRKRDAEAELNLPPGFRFHPTDEELVMHYLCRKVSGAPLPVPIIAEVDLYKFDPWQLPEQALFGLREWYFFTPRDRKYPNGSRPNRAAGGGYWKATGADKPVSPKGSNRTVGIKKALVFYSGKAPKGTKSDWIMHEYRLIDRVHGDNNKKGSLRLDDWVLCRLYNKKNIWEKMQQKKEEAVSHSATTNFSWDEMSNLNNQCTPESEVDNGSSFADVDETERIIAYAWQQAEGRDHINGIQKKDGEAFRKKEENDWFMNLNLDDLQGLCSVAGSTVDVFNQDFLFSNF